MCALRHVLLHDVCSEHDTHVRDELISISLRLAHRDAQTSMSKIIRITSHHVSDEATLGTRDDLHDSGAHNDEEEHRKHHWSNGKLRLGFLLVRPGVLANIFLVFVAAQGHLTWCGHGVWQHDLLQIATLRFHFFDPKRPWIAFRLSVFLSLSMLPIHHLQTNPNQNEPNENKPLLLPSLTYCLCVSLSVPDCDTASPSSCRALSVFPCHSCYLSLSLPLSLSLMPSLSLFLSSLNIIGTHAHVQHHNINIRLCKLTRSASWSSKWTAEQKPCTFRWDVLPGWKISAYTEVKVETRGTTADCAGDDSKHGSHGKKCVRVRVMGLLLCVSFYVLFMFKIVACLFHRDDRRRHENHLAGGQSENVCPQGNCSAALSSGITRGKTQ